MDNRLSTLKALLQKNNLDAMLISSIPNIVYLTNLAYFSELEREAFILITLNNNYIFTDTRYSHAVRTNLKNFTLLEISMITPFVKHLQSVIDQEKIKNFGLEEDNLTLSEFKRFAPMLKQTVHFNLRTPRMIKQNDEITKIKKSCTIGDKAFAFILKKIKVGMTEKEIAFLLETFIRKQGATPSFDTIIAFGPNAAIPHHKSGETKLKTNELMLMDFGVKYENYCSDMTRTVFFGKATKEQKKVYQTVLDAQKLAIQQFNNEAMTQEGVKAQNVDAAAREYIISQNYPSIPHSLGHGIGLQVHEAPNLSPNSKDILTNGMVFSIEPGIYLNDQFGVRIEDLFAIENNKLMQLTQSPNKLIEI